MNKMRSKLLHLLIDPTLSQSDFQWLCSLLNSPQECEQLAEEAAQLRRRVRAFGHTGGAQLPSPAPKSRSFDKEIYRLLRVEIQMPVSEAIGRLYHALGMPIPARKIRGFDHEIERLLAQVPESTLLAAAHNVRNRNVHSKTDNDWPLERDG